MKRSKTVPLTLSEFVQTKCVGRMYDSCRTSPCPYASHDGCTHPDHPKFQKRIRTIEDDWDEPDETNFNLTMKGV